MQMHQMICTELRIEQKKFSLLFLFDKFANSQEFEFLFLFSPELKHSTIRLKNGEVRVQRAENNESNSVSRK